ncbi:hypothetical protein P22_2549 [Propionispora sp. 2/2-37]|uniref:stage II sporulation protein E n=1 Tax=Propionispora sp. 2/2-37 TaxID=1677858 RepID=UPI0006BB71A6|nr:stage II sporulation protein E [Propionispora sp. 2/2-37]CUH96459.1 hypothetical protein P22_2549 [Propionispora sp. 2/2-37]
MLKATVASLPEKTPGTVECVEEIRQMPVVRKLAAKVVVQKIARQILAVITPQYILINTLAFLLSRVTILGEISPFGLAYFAAVAQFLPRQAVPTGFWVVAGTLSGGYYSEALLSVFSVLVYMRLAKRLTLLHKKLLAVPMLLFATILTGGLVLALLSSEQFVLYHILEVTLNAAMAMLLAYAFMYALPVLASAKTSGAQQVSNENFMCVVLLVAVAIGGLERIVLFDFNLQNIASSLFVMALALAGGVGPGAAGGVVVGLASALLAGVDLSIGYYALAGALAGMFHKFGKFAVILGFEFGAVLTVLFFGQAGELIKVVSESSLAAGLFFLLPVQWLGIWPGRLFKNVHGLSASLRIAAATAKLNDVAAMFTDLAASLQQQNTPRMEGLTEEEAAKVLTTVGEQVCFHCTRREICWKTDFYRTYQALMDVWLAADGPIRPDALPQPLRDNCSRKQPLTDMMNAVLAHHGYWQQKTGDQRRLVADHMRALAGIVGNLAQEINQETNRAERLAETLSAHAEGQGIALSGIGVIGEEENLVIRIEKQPCHGQHECRECLLPLAANLTQEQMSLHTQCGNIRRRQNCRIVIQSARRFEVQSGMASAAKEARGVCGDTCRVTKLPQGKILVLLSDGMGIGYAAASESGTAVQVMERLLKAGFAVDAAVKTANAMLLLQEPQETFATMDMAIVDTCNGEVEFLKIGASPSFVKRVHEVGMIRTASLPIGILQQIEIEPVKAQLVAGDIIVMVSDGVFDVQPSQPGKESWLANFLRRMASNNPQEIAQRILAESRRLSGGQIKDDMTVLAVRLAEKTV